MKVMNNHDKQEMFLNYLKDIYIQNPNLPIHSDTIYGELCRFYVNNNEQFRVEEIGLINVQRELANNFSSVFSKGGYFWLVENRNNLSEQEFYNKIVNGIKLYISVDAENIYDIVTKVINFMQQNNIVTQSKVSKILRCDSFVIRVSNMEEANLVINYVNSLNYKSKIEPNPFLYREGKVSIARDGSLSYNSVLSNTLEGYLKDCKKNNKLLHVSIDDFLLYVNRKISEVDISNSTNRDYLMILKIIAKNCDGTITKEFIEKASNINVNKDGTNYIKSDKEKLRYVISLLSNYYDSDTYHKIFENYILDGNINYFTRRDGIRSIVDTNFSPRKLNMLLDEIGRDALYFAVKTTNDKYPNTGQLSFAIKTLLLNSSFNGFTNDFDARSSLALLTSKNRLKRIIMNEIDLNNIDLFDNIDLFTPDEKKAIYTSNYSNFAENEVVRLKNIERMINQVCVLVQNNLLEKMEQESDKKHRR